MYRNQTFNDALNDARPRGISIPAWHLQVLSVRRWPRAAAGTCAAVVVLSVVLTGSLARVATAISKDAEPAGPEQYALLVGCTKYPFCANARELWGPANDIPVFARLLRDKFNFSAQNITQLVGWPEDPASRPTGKNIAAAFDALVAKAKPGVQIVIMMNGHGTQIPIPEDQQDALDPRNRELDGLDEVFLPADVKPGLAEAIRDDQIAQWLDRMQQRGAAVWIIFDCCHSGTMTRSVVEVERSRGVNPWDLGVTAESLKRASRKARAARERSRGFDAAPGAGPRANRIDVPSGREAESGEGRGSVTAFFASQAHETAPELPRPRDAARTRDNYYGLLSFMLTQVLEQSAGRMSYRDLGRQIAARYRAERGSRGPTPMFTGALEQDVLGSQQSTSVPIYLEHVGGKTRLSAGAPAGLTPGAILAVHPPAGGAAQAEEVLGYVEVINVNSTFAEVKSVAYGEQKKAVPLDQLPSLARCSVAAQDLGDLRVSVAVAAAGKRVDAQRHAHVCSALDALPREVANLVHVVDGEAEAQWVLRVTSPAQAKKEFNLDLEAAAVLLVAGEGRQRDATDSRELPTVYVTARKPARRVYGCYVTKDSQQLARLIGRDLRKIFSWQNLWRVAGALSQPAPSARTLKLRVVAAKKPGNASGSDSLPAGNVLRSGDLIELRLVNDSYRDMWVTLIYLDANFGINIWVSESIKGRRSLEPILVQIDDQSLGAEGFVVLAAPVHQFKDQPSYRFLAQSPLGVATRDVAVAPPAPRTPFDRLARAIKAGSPVRHRARVVAAPTNPQVLSWTWFSVPADAEPPE